MNNTAMDMGNMVQLVTFNYNPSRSLIRNSEVRKRCVSQHGPGISGWAVCVSVVLACFYRVNINILVGGEGGQGHAYDSNKMGGGRAGRSSVPEPETGVSLVSPPSVGTLVSPGDSGVRILSILLMPGW